MTDEAVLTVEPQLGLPPQRQSAAANSDCDAVRNRNILIVGINYAPEPTGIGPYTTATAEHLAQSAASVTVLTGLPSYPEWNVPREYRGRRQFRESPNGVEVHRLWHAVPRRQDAARRGLYEASFLAHAASTQVSQRPDLVIGVTPALGGALAAAHLAERYDAPLVVIVQDVLGAAATQSGIAGGGRVAQVVARAEGRALRRADQIVVVSDSFRAPLREYGIDSTRVHTIRNWSRVPAARRDRGAERTRLGWSDATVVLHSGNMGLKQGLEVVVEAARLTRDRQNLRWVLMGDGSQRADLQRLGHDLPNLEFLPLCDTDDYPEILAAADILLLCERPGVLDMSLPSKLTSYFTSGVPVASAVSAEGSTAKELARAGALAPTAPGDAAALVDQILALGGDPLRRTSLAATAARHAKENLTFAAASRRLDAVLARAVLDSSTVPDPSACSARGQRSALMTTQIVSRRIGQGPDDRSAPLEPPMLNLGSGPTVVPGWVNIDRSPNALLDRWGAAKRSLRWAGVISETHMTSWPREIVRADIRRLAYADFSVRAVYSSHTLEHLYYREAEQVLRESLRVLQAGSVLRLALPDAEAMAREFTSRCSDGDPTATLDYNRQLNAHPLERPGLLTSLRNLAGGHTHRWQPSPALLENMLVAAGFTEVHHRSFRVGRCPGLEAVETRPNSFFIEGVK